MVNICKTEFYYYKNFPLFVVTRAGNFMPGKAVYGLSTETNRQI